MSALDNPQVDTSLEEFLRSVRPRLKALFVRYGIPPQDTEDILQQALLALVYQRQMVRDAEAWLLGTLRNEFDYEILIFSPESGLLEARVNNQCLSANIVARPRELGSRLVGRPEH